MPKLPRWSGAEVIRRLQELGYIQIRQSGSQVVLKKQSLSGELGCVVPLHQELAYAQHI